MARLTSLLARLEVRRMTVLAAEHRLAKQRQAIDRALTRLRTGDAPPYVVLWLQQQGVRITEKEPATEGGAAVAGTTGRARSTTQEAPRA